MHYNFIYYFINGEVIKQSVETSDTTTVAANVECFDISENGKLAFLLNDRTTLYVDSSKYPLTDSYRDFYWFYLMKYYYLIQRNL